MERGRLMKNLRDEVLLKSGVALKNRLVMAPMTTQQSFFNGVVTEEEIAYYAERSKGIGAVITGTAYIQADGKGWLGELGANEDKQIFNLAKLASAIKANGAKAILQIFHAGRMTDHIRLAGEQIVSASEIPAERENAETPRALSHKEILEIIANFGKATERAIEAGFDGVEIHGANTYLIQQFFSPHSNRRNDEWGGSLEKRMKFPKEVVKIVTETVKKNTTAPFAVGYRISPEEYEEPGIKFGDTLKLIDELCKEPLDYLHISLSTYNKISVSEKFDDKSILEYVEKTVASRLPVISVGGVRNEKDVNEALNHSDIVALGKQMIVDPLSAKKIVEGIVPEAGEFAELFKTINVSEAFRDFLVK